MRKNFKKGLDFFIFYDIIIKSSERIAIYGEMAELV